jgi:hypothetical protein
MCEIIEQIAAVWNERENSVTFAVIFSGNEIRQKLTGKLSKEKPDETIVICDKRRCLTRLVIK